MSLGSAITKLAYPRSNVRLRWIVLALIVLTWGILPALPAKATIPDLFVNVNNPNPNPVAAGSTSTTTAVFSLGADIGPLTVGIQLQGPAGFGSLRLDAANTSGALTNCVETASEVSCDWDGLMVNGPQTLGVFIDTEPDASPFSQATLAAVASSAMEPTETYSTAQIGVIPPPGGTTLSGSVITDGGAPVAEACIFLLSSPSFVFPTLTDANGEWEVAGLPDNYSFAVGVVPPFDVGFGPCASNGPPPVPAPGELQPVFYDDIWIDLNDPQLTGGQGDPFDFAVAAGATVFSSSAAGIGSCLTTAPASAVPRPPCIAAVTTTTTAGTTTTEAGVGDSGETTTTAAAELPFTGMQSSIWAISASVLILLGLGVVGLVKRGQGTE